MITVSRNRSNNIPIKFRNIEKITEGKRFYVDDLYFYVRVGKEWYDITPNIITDDFSMEIENRSREASFSMVVPNNEAWDTFDNGLHFAIGFREEEEVLMFGIITNITKELIGFNGNYLNYDYKLQKASKVKLDDKNNFIERPEIPKKSFVYINDDPIEEGRGDQFYHYKISIVSGKGLIPKRRHGYHSGMDEDTYAGDLINLLLDRFIINDGEQGGYPLKKGVINKGANVLEKNFYRYSAMNFAELFDKLANISGYEWFIDYRNYFHFIPKLPQDFPVSGKNKTLGSNLPEDEKNFEVLSYERDITDYVNKVFVQGGVPYEDIGDIPDGSITPEGYLIVGFTLEDEVEKRAIKEGNNGTYGIRVNEPDVHYLEDMENIAKKYLDKYGKIAVKMEINTLSRRYKINNRVLCEFPEYQLDNEYLRITKVSVSTILGNTLVFSYTLENQDYALSRKENIVDYLKGRDLLIASIKGGAEDEEASEMPTKNLSLWIDMQDEESFTAVDGKIQSVSGQGMMSGFAQLNKEQQPKLMKNGRFNFMRFNDFDDFPELSLWQWLPANADFYSGTQYVVGSLPSEDKSKRSTLALFRPFYSSSSGGWASNVRDYHDILINGVPAGNSHVYEANLVIAINNSEGNYGEKVSDVSKSQKVLSLGLNWDSPSNAYRNKFLRGDIYEVLVYDEIHNPEQMQKISSLLMEKYSDILQ